MSWAQGDFNDDGEVGLGDLSLFAAACDFDGDGEVGLGDLSYFAAAYGQGQAAATLDGSSTGSSQSATLGESAPAASLAAARPADDESAGFPSDTALLDDLSTTFVAAGEISANDVSAAPAAIETAAAHDAALVETYGPRAWDPSSISSCQCLAVSQSLARREVAHRDKIIEQTPAAVEWLLGDRHR